MKTLIHLTDLHLDGWPHNLDAAVELVGNLPADLFLVGGDNGDRSDIAATVAALRKVQPGAAIGWVMGNHDLWGGSIDRLWEDPHLPDATYLELVNLETDFCTVVGSYGHYDYTGGDRSISIDDYEAYRYGSLGWGDYRIERGGRTNPEIAAEVADRFSNRYRAAVERGLPIVVVTHTLPFVELCAFERSFYGAYGTNAALGRCLLDAPRTPAVLFCGHTHNPIRSSAFGFPMINTGSDYDAVRITRWELE